MSESLEQQVIRIIAEAKNLDPQTLSVNTPMEEIGLDSLDAMSIIFDLENAFEVEIPEEAAEQARTVGDLVEGVSRLIRERGGESAAPQA